ncbi:MAG: hypothetical protein JWL72_2471 [Ilumatobacteraceae bacterium]|nr:hypothetical protein [Ilumatobacteraceae bacterium]
MKIASYTFESNGDALLSIWDNSVSLESAGHPAGAEGVAWWIGDRHRPTVAEAERRLAFLRVHRSSPYAFELAAPDRQLSVDRVELDDVDVQLLIAQLNADLYARYPEPGALVFSLDPADIVDGVGSLLLAELGGRPVGCAAFRIIDGQPGSAEIKRMYVAPSARGNKIGAALLDEVEHRARSLGVTRFALETGPRQPEALALFERAGYVGCSPWGAFVGKDFSVCMERTVV